MTTGRIQKWTAQVLTALALTQSMSVCAMDIWGKGDVPRITDPKDVPQRCSPRVPKSFQLEKVGDNNHGRAS
jgi:hypothetical protein